MYDGYRDDGIVLFGYLFKVILGNVFLNFLRWSIILWLFVRSENILF